METGRRGRYVCALCSKYFATESTHKRHGYYCRSKKIGQSASRQRSCTSCTKAKIGCDSKRPHCSTCTRKHITCQYAQGAVRYRDTDSDPHALATNPEDEVVRNDSLEALDDGLHVAKDGQSLHSPQMSDPVLTYETQVVQKDFSFLDLETLPSALLWDLDSDTALLSHLTAESNFPLQITAPSNSGLLRARLQPFPTTVPAPLALSLFSRSMSLRSLRGSETQMCSIFLTRIIGYYPAMMLRPETFPPFVHALHFSQSRDEGRPSESLVNCMSIAQLFVNSTRETRKFLWGTVRMEQERMWHEYEGFNNWELLASVQALMIYIIMRIVEGPTEDNSFDIPLLLSLHAVASTLDERFGGDKMKSALSGDKQDWKQWIFHESRRRQVFHLQKVLDLADRDYDRVESVAHILNKFIDLGNAVRCIPFGGYALPPLPAKKALWEAQTAEKWRKEFDITLREQELFALSNDGTLTKLRLGYGGLLNTSAADWGKWYAEMDSFGTLIMIASSLLKSIS